MNETTKYLNEKEQLIESIAEQLNSWDSTVESALTILETNNETIQQLIVVDKKIPDNALEEFNKKNHDQWAELLNTQKKLMQVVQEAQTETQQQLKQISNKEKVVSSYISLQNKSMFIEKDY